MNAEPLRLRLAIFSDVRGTATSTRQGWTDWDSLVRDLCDPPEYAAKADCPLIKLATFGNKESANGSLRHDGNVLNVSGLEGDHDAGTLSPQDAAELLRQAGVRALIYTTASHTPSHPRWRVLAPLSRPHAPEERARFVGLLNAILNGALARESFVLSQAFYHGRIAGAAYEAIPVAGIPLDLLSWTISPLFPAGMRDSAHVRSVDDPMEFDRQATRESALRNMTVEVLDELRAAIGAIPAEGRDVWIRMGQALASLKGSEWEDAARELWEEWSATSAKWEPDRDPEQWLTFRGERTSYKAVFAEAQRFGWNNPGAGRQRRERVPAPIHDTPVFLRRASDITPRAVAWLWGGWLARGKLHVFAGVGGQGKTTVALSFAAIVSSGGRWPDGTKCDPANVLIWSGEDGVEDTLVPRLIAMGADMDRVYFVQSVAVEDRQVTFDPSAHMDALAETARKLGGIGLVLVDPIVSAITGDSHKATEVRRGLQPLVDLADSTGAALLGISHFAKNTSGREPTERVVGSLSYGAVARVVLCAAKVQDADAPGDRRVLVRSKSNIGPDHGGFEYSVEFVGIPGVPEVARIVWGKAVDGSAKEILNTAEGAERDEPDTIDVERFLAEAVRAGPVSTRQLMVDAKGAGFTWGQVKRAKKRLRIVSKKRGMDGGWSWTLPGAEADFMDMPEENEGIAESL
jgi:putative DNA primase/helicase